MSEKCPILKVYKFYVDRLICPLQSLTCFQLIKFQKEYFILKECFYFRFLYARYVPLFPFLSVQSHSVPWFPVKMDPVIINKCCINITGSRKRPSSSTLGAANTFHMVQSKIFAFGKVLTIIVLTNQLDKSFFLIRHRKILLPKQIRKKKNYLL